MSRTLHPLQTATKIDVIKTVTKPKVGQLSMNDVFLSCFHHATDFANEVTLLKEMLLLQSFVSEKEKRFVKMKTEKFLDVFLDTLQATNL